MKAIPLFERKKENENENYDKKISFPAPVENGENIASDFFNKVSGDKYKLVTIDVWDTLLRRTCSPDETKLAGLRYLYLNYLNEQEVDKKKKKNTSIRYKWCKAHCWNIFHVMDANSRDMMGIQSARECMKKCMKNPVTWKPKGGIQEI